VQQAAPSFEHDLPADWRVRLRSRLLAQPEHRLEHCRLGSGIAPGAAQTLTELLEGLAGTLQAAAVLIPIIERPAAPMLLLTVRASHLTRHAGQISFPGGRLEARDADVAAAALRETEEETGIHARFVEPIGFLPDHIVATGYRITPVVALVRPGFILKPDSTEVADVFELPLAVALVSGNYRVQRRLMGGREADSWELCFGEYRIWGATARMLRTLSELMGEGAA
jgi:8-oxo-dGTP pyrophosphatase MutT (NUDIX family)